MGLFDTIHLSEPLHLAGCDQPVTEIQTKEFGNTMRDYFIGSVLDQSAVLTGVVEGSVWCETGGTGGEGQLHPVYFAVRHRILAGVYLDPSAAEERLKTVDRLDLIGWLDEAQRESRRWKQRYHRLFSDVEEWHERSQEPEESTDSKKARLLFHRLPDEILQAPDPLAAILASHRKQESEDVGAGWLG